METFIINRIAVKNTLLSMALVFVATAPSFAALAEEFAAPYTVNSYGDQGVIENNAYTSPAASLTGSPSGSVVYSLSGTDETLFTINSSTGVVSMVARDYENPLDGDGNNLYSVLVTATDGASNTASRNLDVVVFNDCSSNDGPSVFKLSSPDSLGDLAGDDASLKVSLLGSGGTPLQGVAVTFARTSGSATISSPSGTTGVDGSFTSVVTSSSTGVSLFTAMYDSSGDGTPDTMVTLGSPTGIQFTSDVSSFAIRGMVGIGTEDPDPSSVLEVAGTEKGVLIPRIALTSSTDISTIVTPALSLLIYNTANTATIGIGFVFWDGSVWKNVCTR
jgi:hypothetical protein